MIDVSVLKREERMRNVAKAWNDQYYVGGVWREICNGNAEETYNLLVLLLKEEYTREDIDTVIGNNSWTEISCNICGEDVDVAIVLDDGTYDHYVCRRCLKDMMGLLGGE